MATITSAFNTIANYRRRWVQFDTTPSDMATFFRG